MERRNDYVIKSPLYEAVVKREYETLVLAVEALATYYAAQARTHTVRTALEDEASKLLINANRVANTEHLTMENFLPND
jgi:hypothetical protein